MLFTKTIGAICLILCLTGSIYANTNHELHIMEMTDLHSFIAGSIHNPGQGSLADIVEFYEALQTKYPSKTLFLSSGDNHQGTSLSDAEKPIPGVTNIQLLFNNTDDSFLSGIGNHDTDVIHCDWIYNMTHSYTSSKPNFFGDRYISTNLKVKKVNRSSPIVSDIASSSPHFDYYTNTRWAVREIDGIKIFIFSILDKNWVHLPEYLENIDPVTALDTDFETEFKNVNPDFVICLLHAGLMSGAERQDWIPGITEKIRDFKSDVPMIYFHGHDHQKYDYKCMEADGKTEIPNCHHYDLNANFGAVGVLTFNFELADDRSATNFNHSRTTFKNTRTELANYLGVSELPCGEKCQSINASIYDLVDKVHMLDPVGTTDKAYLIPRDGRKFYDEDSTYYLYFTKIVPLVYGENKFTVLNTGTMKGGLPKGDFNVNDLFSFYPYDNHMIEVSNVTAKAIYAISNRNQVPPNDDPTTWSIEPYTTGDAFYVYPFINTTKMNETYTIRGVNFELNRWKEACQKVNASCVIKEYPGIDFRGMTHDAVKKIFPYQAAVDTDTDSVTKMPGWAWVLVVIASVLALSTFVCSFLLSFKKPSASSKMDIEATV